MRRRSERRMLRSGRPRLRSGRRCSTSFVRTFASFSSGALHSRIGWEAVILGMALPLIIATAVVIQLKIKTRHATS